MHVCFPVMLSRWEIGLSLQHFQSTTGVIPTGLSHQALVILLALQSTDSNLSSWKGICCYCTNDTREERRAILKTSCMKMVSFPVQAARDRARLCLYTCVQRASETLKEYPEVGSQVQGDSNEEQLLATHPSAAGVSRPQRFKSALLVTNSLTRPSVWAQNAHSLPSVAAQILTIHRQYRACYGLANEQLLKPIERPSSLVLVIWILREWEYCLFF